ncbi:uncharacterized protein BP5553_00081 [Venustampulla echinocandica]|uniref:Tat pathway signal sequence n=1 Tax=Venustampulla echinocandica TaxID=2656787 RepID=A0A370TX47_9HELO|nr:uncharacterized protein BP5553_00081 [Venustampulla echinocandica]RDL40102.1 hypothetical protein BP5553_00081 [Venustampulla echinocandica]
MGPASEEVKYTPVSKDEGSLEDIIHADKSTPRSSTRRFCNSPVITLLNVFLFLVSLIILFNSANPITRPNWAFEQTAYYSPLFRRIKIPVVKKTVQGTLFNEENLILRAYPSPEVDAAWEALTDVGVVIITGEEVSKLGKDPSKTVKAPREWGHGDDAHLAQLDGQHALHCLNAVRRYAYREYYFPAVQTSNTSRSSPFEPFDQAHLSHCLHVLLQTLSCDFSADVITHNWMDTQNYPFPDFAINKKCKDHEKLVDWQTKHRISQDQWMEMGMRGASRREPGEYVKQLPPMMKHWVEHGEEDGQTGHNG